MDSFAQLSLHHVRTRSDGAVGVVALDRPPVNAFDRATVEELQAAFAAADADPDVRVVLLRSDNPRFFCAGADLEEIRHHDPAAMTRFADAVKALILGMRGSPKLYVAAIHGPCLGGGLELALGCDRRLATPAATFGFPEVRLGIFPGGGGIQLAQRLVGAGRALAWALTGESIPAETAVREGLVDVMLPADAWDAAARAEAARFAAGPSLAYGAIKRAVYGGQGLALADALRVEGELHAPLIATEDCREGVASFVGKRAARFAGR